MKPKKPYARSSMKEKLLLPAVIGMALLALILVGVLPSFREIDETRLAIVELEADLKQQRALLPIYISLQQRKKESLPEGIHVTERQPLQIEELVELPDVFEALARKSGAELVSATPQVRSLRDGREMLRIDTRIRGELLTFNILLNRLNEMPFVESIESLAIDVTNLGQEMSLSIWLAIQ